MRSKIGIGCDQLLLIDNATDGDSDFLYRIFNSDGSIAGQCGNGARCLIRYIIEHNLTTKRNIQLQTSDRTICGRMLDDGLVEVGMGIPLFEADTVSLLLPTGDHYHYDVSGEPISFAAVSMGNPHAVIQVNSSNDLVDDPKLASVSESLQRSSVFPESVSVNFIFIENRPNILLRTYERGDGCTLACGSGACASAAVAIRDNLVDNKVRVKMFGGSLDIEWHGSQLLMCGTAAYVFDGEIVL